MRGAHDRAPRIGDGRHASLAEQPHVVSLQGGNHQVAGVKAAVVVAIFVYLAWKLDDVHGLYRHAQRVDCINAFEVGAGGFGVFTNPVRERCGGTQAGIGQGLAQIGHHVATEIQRRGDQKQAPACRACARHPTLPRIGIPAARSMRAVSISGRPTKALGSLLSMRSSSAIPKPSLLALPAQS